VVELVDTRDLKSLAIFSIPVRVWARAPKKNFKVGLDNGPTFLLAYNHDKDITKERTLRLGLCLIFGWNFNVNFYRRSDMSNVYNDAIADEAIDIVAEMSDQKVLQVLFINYGIPSPLDGDGLNVDNWMESKRIKLTELVYSSLMSEPTPVG